MVSKREILPLLPACQCYFGKICIKTISGRGIAHIGIFGRYCTLPSINSGRYSKCMVS
jgi:hypothetical protein